MDRDVHYGRLKLYGEENEFNASEDNLLIAQGNLANTYHMLGRLDEELRLRRDVWLGMLKLHGEEDFRTLIAAQNCAGTLLYLRHHAEAKILLRRSMAVARRVLGDCHHLTIMMRKIYAQTLYQDAGATLNELREAVTTLEETERIARRVLGGPHPVTVNSEDFLRESRAALLARETPSSDA